MQLLVCEPAHSCTASPPRAGDMHLRQDSALPAVCHLICAELDHHTATGCYSCAQPGARGAVPVALRLTVLPIVSIPITRCHSVCKDELEKATVSLEEHTRTQSGLASLPTQTDFRSACHSLYGGHPCLPGSFSHRHRTGSDIHPAPLHSQSGPALPAPVIKSLHQMAVGMSGKRKRRIRSGYAGVYLLPHRSVGSTRAHS